MNVPLQDPAREYRALRDRLDEALLEVAASGRYVLGPEGEALEAELARYLGVDHAVAVGSGTDALALCLRVLDVGPGDEVVLPPFSFFATAEAVLRAGAEPVFADVLPRTFDLDPEAAEAAVTDRTAAVMPVHLYGQMADVEGLAEVADRHGLALVEDAAQALGAARLRDAGEASGAPSGRGSAGAGGGPGAGGANGDDAADGGDGVDGDGGSSGGDRWLRAGAAGDAACFSFYPTKNLAAMGDGGLVATDDPGAAERLRRLRDHGRDPERGGRHREAAWNSRLDEIQAAVLRVKLESLEEWNGRRRRNARAYDRALEEVDGVEAPAVRPGGRHVYHQYTLRCRDREALSRHLEERGVGHGVYYPVPLHLQEPLAHRSPGEGAFPEAERAAREVLSLPVFPLLEAEEREAVVEALRSFGA